MTSPMSARDTAHPSDRDSRPAVLLRDVKPLGGELAGLLRLRVANHRVLFDETADTITIHRIGDRRDIYR